MSQVIPTDAPDLLDSKPLSGVHEAVLMLFCAYDGRPDKREIAERLHLPLSTVRAICSTQEFKKQYRDVCMSVSHERLREVLDRNAEMAAAGEPKHTNMFLKMHGLIHDKASEPKPEQPKMLDNEELEKRKTELMQQLKAEARREVEEEMKRGAIEAKFTEVKHD